MSFVRLSDVTVGNVLVMMGFLKRLTCDFKDLYTLRTIYVHVLRSKLEYTSCVWWLLMMNISIQLSVRKEILLDTLCEP
jgi:hypothetical protein